MSLSLSKISGPKKASISNFVESHGVGYSISTAVKYTLLVIMSLIIILPIRLIMAVIKKRINPIAMRDERRKSSASPN